MEIQRQLADEGVDVRRVEHDDAVAVVADFGPGDASVDVLDEMVIVVTGDEQYELDFEEDARAFIRNGVLTIEVRQ